MANVPNPNSLTLRFFSVLQASALSMDNHMFKEQLQSWNPHTARFMYRLPCDVSVWAEAIFSVETYSNLDSIIFAVSDSIHKPTKTSKLKNAHTNANHSMHHEFLSDCSQFHHKNTKP